MIKPHDKCLKEATKICDCIKDTIEILQSKLNRINKKAIKKILSDSKYWCPSKKQQWERMSNAIVALKKGDIV